MNNDRQSGVIKRLIPDRGFGFIRTSSGREIFFHVRALADGVDFEALEQGQAVVFVEGKDATGRPRAVDVQLVSGIRE